MEYERVLAPDRPPLERIKDYGEFHTALSAEAQRQQAARCMDCGTPFCHSGLMIGGGASGCPLSNLIPEFNDLIYRGQWEKAFRRLMKTNDFPEFTGRVCPALCEGACTTGLGGAPTVTIRANECAIIEKAFENGWIRPCPPETRTGKKVAVIGSGPSGLACADRLNKLGHSVTVFERSDRPGGLLMYGIPNMKLDKSVVARRVKLMTDEGVTFLTRADIAREYPGDSLLKEFDAAVLCTGSTRPRPFGVTGADAAGIHYAVDFLKANTKSLLDSNHADGRYISAAGKDVIVVGGGDTGTDCVATALRHGCRSITQFEIMPPAPKERAANNPWPEWPKVFKTDYGQEEAAAVFGSDPRHFCIMTTSVDKDAAGGVCALNTVNVEWRASEGGGRPSPVPIPGAEKKWPAQLVLIAMGFVGPEQELPTQLGAAFTSRGNIETDSHRMTKVNGLFAAGDARRGQSLVVWAINEGREAARECDEYLSRK